MSLSLYIILSVCVLIGVVFLMLSLSQKEEKVSLDPPKVRGGTLFVPTVKHHVKIDPPPIMKSRLDPKELFVDYTLPGFQRPSPGGSSAGVAPVTPPGTDPVSGSDAVDPLAEEALKQLEADAAIYTSDQRLVDKMEAQEAAAKAATDYAPLLNFVDHGGSVFKRKSNEDPFELVFSSPVITKPSVSANPDLDPSTVDSDEELQLKRNGALMAFLSNSEMFDIYMEIMGKIHVLLDDDPNRDVRVEYVNQLNKRDLSEKARNLLLTTFYEENPELVYEVLGSETYYGDNEVMPIMMVERE